MNTYPPHSTVQKSVSKTTSTLTADAFCSNDAIDTNPLDGLPIAQHSGDDRFQQYYNEKWVAARLGISTKTLQSWRDKGCGPPFHKFGTAVRYSLHDIETFERAAVRYSTADDGNGADNA